MVSHPNRGRGRPRKAANGEPRTKISVLVDTDVLTALPPAGEGRSEAVNTILRTALIA